MHFGLAAQHDHQVAHHGRPPFVIQLHDFFVGLDRLSNEAQRLYRKFFVTVLDWSA